MKNTNQLISVIMGVHNASKKKCTKAINSIINQTYPNWELIICDDCSEDDTLSFLKKFSKKDKRIKIISNKINLGLAATLNNCIKNCCGDFIARMDDDDYSLPTRFEEELKFLLKNEKYGFVSSNYYVDTGNDQHLRRMVERPQKEDFLWTSPYLHPATMFRKEALLKVNCYRDVRETRRAEDYDLFMRMKVNGINGYNLQVPYYVYYIGKIENKQKQKYIYRIFEAKVRYTNFKRLNFPLSKVLVYTIKPLIVGLFPSKILYKIRTK